MTFKECAEAYIAAHETGWKNAKHRQQWRNTLKTLVYPKMGDLLVSDIEKSHVMAVIEPLWLKTTETAKRLRGRIEIILAWATARELRKGDNPARWNGWLQTQLPSPGKIAKVVHHKAFAINEIGGFVEKLRKQEGVGSRALEFAILTAGRSAEILGAKWSEIDFTNKVWIVPANRMKGAKEHRVALSADAIQLLNKLPRTEGVDLIFVSPRGGALSNMAMTAIVRRMGHKETVHGMRSTFSDWAAERTNYPRDVVEMALSHAVSNKVEAAYRRGDLLEKRYLLMADWAAFCAKNDAPAEIIPINREMQAA
jgi:integrase